MKVEIPLERSWLRKLSRMVFVFGVLMLFGCDQDMQSTGLIRTPVQVSMKSIDCELVVGVKNQIVTLDVTNSKGETILDFGERPSSLQKWAAFWDDKSGLLWFTSSDIGTFAFKKNDTGMFEKTSLREMSKQDAKQMPDAMYRTLPSAVQKLVDKN